VDIFIQTDKFTMKHVADKCIHFVAILIYSPLACSVLYLCKVYIQHSFNLHMHCVVQSSCVVWL